MDAAKLPREGGRLRLRCKCGHSFRARFVPRRYLRLSPPLYGFFANRSRRGAAGSLQVHRIAPNGLRFDTADRHALAEGEVLDVALTLRTIPPQALQLEVRVADAGSPLIKGAFVDPLPGDLSLERLVHEQDQPRLLILDDSLGRAAELEGHLDNDWGVQVVTSADDALERLQYALPFDLLLVGASFFSEANAAAGRGGRTCELLAQAASQGVPALALLQDASPAAVAAALEAGASDCIHYPFHRPTVQARVRTALELRRAREDVGDMARSMARESLSRHGRIRWLENAHESLQRACHDILDANDRLLQGAKEQAAPLAEYAHEMRTSLGVLSGALEMALERGPEGPLKRYLDTAAKQGKTLLGLLADLEKFSRDSYGSLELQAFDFDVQALIWDLADAYSLHAQRKGLYFRHRVAPSVPSYLHGDGLRLRQVLSNLIGNACKFTEEGGVTLSVALAQDQGAAQDGGVVLQFKISDTGPGVPEDQRERLRQGEAGAEPGRCSGLGLSICSRLARLMGGEIHCRQRPQGGTSFIVQIPLQVGREQKNLPPLRSKSARKPGRLPRLRVLLVVADRLSREMLVDLLEDKGHSVTAAQSSRVVLELLSRGIFDAAIIDGELSLREGNVTARSIRSPRGTVLDSELPLLGLCVSPAREEQGRLLAAGFTECLPRPVSWPVLQAALGRTVRQGAMEEAAPQSRLEEITPAAGQAAGRRMLPEALPGLDLEDAMQRMQGRADRFLYYLDIFLQEHGEDAGDIEAALEGGDVADALERSRALAAAAADMAARDLARAARRLTELLLQGRTAEALEAAVPLRQALETVLASARDQALAGGEAQPRAADAMSASGARTLVVEDSQAGREHAVGLLESLGFSVLAAQGGAEALELAGNRQVDLVLLDIQMPGMSGYQVCASLRRLPAFARTPIVAMTAYDARGVWDRCLVAGMDMLLEKPLDRDTLRTSLGRWFSFDALDLAGQDHGQGAGDDGDASADVGAGPAAWPQLPGVDVEQAREQFGGDSELFRKFLRTFGIRHSSDPELLREAMEEGDEASLAAVARGLLGSAANIAAVELLERARAVEALAGDESAVDAGALAEELIQALQRLLQGIAGLRQPTG